MGGSLTVGRLGTGDLRLAKEWKIENGGNRALMCHSQGGIPFPSFLLFRDMRVCFWGFKKA